LFGSGAWRGEGWWLLTPLALVLYILCLVFLGFVAVSGEKLNSLIIFFCFNLKEREREEAGAGESGLIL
jgi:hypothetical protein